jgi:hypothetical protein
LEERKQIWGITQQWVVAVYTDGEKIEDSAQ